MTRLTDFDSSRPRIQGAQWNHGTLDTVTENNKLLKLLYINGIVNLGDWRLNGIPLSTDANASPTSATAQYRSGHGPLAKWQKGQFDKLRRLFEMADPSQKDVVKATEFAPQVRGLTEMMRSGAAPLKNAAGDFIDGFGNVLSPPNVWARDLFLPVFGNDFFAPRCQSDCT
jgi:hypothetical protein